MKKLTRWKKQHPDLYEFITFNILSNCATITNFIVMWICTGFIFRGLKEIPFQVFIFDYTTRESLMLCGFLSFLISTTVAQTVNFFVQKKLVFHSEARFQKAVPEYIVLAVVLVIISSALPAYSQKILIHMGVSESITPTLANIINILVQVIISYPTMKFVIMKEDKNTKDNLLEFTERKGDK